MIIIICIIDQLTNWRCPGLGPGSASKEFVEEGEREQRPRGLWDVSNTCSWIKVGLQVGVYVIFCIFTTSTILITWVGVDVNVKTLTMESKTTTIRSRRSRTHLTCARTLILRSSSPIFTSVENSSSMTIFFLRSSQTQTLFPGYLERKCILWSQKKSPNFGFWVCTISGKIQRQILPTPWVLTTSNHGQIVTAEEHFKISKSSTSSVAPVLWLFNYIPWQYFLYLLWHWHFLLLLIIFLIRCFAFVILSNHLSLLFPQWIWIINAEPTLSANTEAALDSQMSHKNTDCIVRFLMAGV